MLTKKLPKVLPVPLMIYVAGKLTGETLDDTEKYAQLAEEHALKVFQLGHNPITPHSMYRTWREKERAEPDFRNRIIHVLNLAMLRKCDAISVVPGWETSIGTKIEIAYMNRLQRPVYFSLDDIPKVVSEPSQENVWMMETNDIIDGAARLRLLYGLEKYGNSWTNKDNINEALEEVLDTSNYGKLEIFRLLRLIQKRDGVFPKFLGEVEK